MSLLEGTFRLLTLCKMSLFARSGAHMIPFQPGEGARHVFASSTNRCRVSSECASDTESCLMHVDEAPASRLLQLHVDGKPAILFIGHPFELLRDVAVMDFAPKEAWVWMLWPPTLYVGDGAMML